MGKNVPTVSIFGVPFSKLSAEETADLVTAMADSGRPHQVITANPIMVMAALQHPDNMAMMKRADLIVPDGAGIVWAAGYVGNPVAGKVAGIELMHELLRRGEKKGWRVYLLGTTPETIRIAANKLKEQYPAIALVGFRDGFFKADQDEEVVAHIREAKPHLLFVARGADTQDPWIDRYKAELGVPVMMGVGGSLDIMAGRAKRAPKLFIRLRLEWFYRLLREPSRYRRMLALPQFAFKVIREKENVQKR